MPLYSRSYEAEPSALDMKALFKKPLSLYRRPDHFISENIRDRSNTNPVWAER